MGRPRKVEVSFQKAKPKRKRGRPKGSGKLQKPLPRPNRDLQADREAYLAEHDGEKPYLELLKDYQATCDCSLNPYRVLATKGTYEDRYEIRSCTNCLKKTKVSI